MLRCSVVWAVFRRNLAAYFTGALGPLIILVFVAADAARTFNAEFFANNLATLDQLTIVFPQLLLSVIPAITMSVWADERRQGTDELLFTMPATDVEILLGKYCSSVAFYTVALLFTVPKLFVLEYYANPDWNLLFTTYLGYWLTGASLISAGMFASALVGNTTAAYVLGAAFCAVPVFVGTVAFGNRAVESLSLSHHLSEFGVGLVPFGGLVYFLSFTGLMLYLNYVVVTRRHWSADRSAGMGLHYAVRVVCLLVALVAVNYAIRKGSEVANLRVDATTEGLHTLTDETRSILRAVPETAPVEVTAFVSPELPRDHVDQGRALRRLLQQYKRLGSKQLLVRLVETEPHTEAAEEAETFGITPRTIDHEDLTGQRRDEVFLGAVVTGTGGEVVIPFLEPAASVEYEMTRAIATVTQRERLKVGLVETPASGMLDASLRGGAKSAFVSLLEKHYDVDTIFPSSAIDLDRVVDFDIWTEEDQRTWDAWRKREAERRAEEEAKENDDDPNDPSDDGDATPDGETDTDGETNADSDGDDQGTDTGDTDPDGSADDEEAKEDDDPKPREKPEQRSRYLEADPSAELDDGKLPEEFRKRLEWRSVTLSDEAKVDVVAKGRWWRIDDVNPTKSYTVKKDEHEITVSYPRYDVVVAVMPSGLTEPEMTNLVDYVQSGRPVLIFDDPLPLHLGGFLAVDQSPNRDRQSQPQRPGMPPPPAEEKADGGKLTSLLRSLGIGWTYDEIVWDEYDPHPKFREFPAGPQLEIPLLYVNGDNGTDSALADDPVTSGLGELQFIYPGRINPLTNSRFDFHSLVRVGPESGTYEWDDVLSFRNDPFRGPDLVMEAAPKKTVVQPLTVDFDVDDDVRAGGYEFYLDGELRSATKLELGVRDLETGDHSLEIRRDGARVASRTIELVAEDPVPKVVVATEQGKLVVDVKATEKAQPERKRRFCLAARVSAPRRVIVELDLPRKETEEAHAKLAEAIAKALAEVEGVEAVESRIERRLGTAYHVTLVDVARDVVEPEAPKAEDPADETDDDGSGDEDESKKDDGPLDTRQLTETITEKVTAATKDLVQKGDVPRVSTSSARSAVVVADGDCIGNLPLVYFEDDPEDRMDFRLDNSKFVQNAIDVLAGRDELVRLQARRPRHRILTEIERRTQKLDAATTTQIREALEKKDERIEESQESYRERRKKIEESEGLSFVERLQQESLAFGAESRSLQRELEKIEAETDRTVAKLKADQRREVLALQNDIRTRAIAFPLIPAILFAVCLGLWQFLSERMHVDPARSR